MSLVQAIRTGPAASTARRMVALLLVGLLLLMAGATRAASASPLRDLDYVPASALATTLVCQSQGAGCGYDGARLAYDAPAHVVLEHAAELDATEAAMVGLKGAGDEAAVSVSHVYGAPSDLVAPNAARAAGETSDVLLNSSRQLQRKWKHAADFGVEGNYNPSNAARYSEALNQHINSPLTTAIEGTYRGNPVTHHLDPSTGLNVIADPAGNYVSGWRLGPEQLENVLRHGGLN